MLAKKLFIKSNRLLIFFLQFTYQWFVFYNTILQLPCKDKRKGDLDE